MSSLWTPGGERPVGQPDPQAPGQPPAGAPPGAGGPGGPGPDEEVDAQQVEEMRRQLAATPADVVIANHCYGLFELAAVYLSQVPPMLPKARLAIDAMTAVVEGLEGRLGESEPQLLEGLSQLRLAYVQIDGAQRAAGDAAGTAPANGAPADGGGNPAGPESSTPPSDGPSDGSGDGSAE
ncbi:MAG TPA: hypothetical protein VNV87_01915 [Acidimicrobiales bacterium]|jgi:hypothetical protein|nr:hypothetical protein [Acidimicrobiales bacterium]